MNEPSGGAFQDATRKREVETSQKPERRSVGELEERREGEESIKELSRGWIGVKSHISFTHCRNQLLDPEWKPDQLYRIKFI